MITQLFIEDIEVELTNDVKFSITKTYEDTDDPTAIISDWSKSVDIPFTAKNNNLFGNIYDTKRVIVDGGSNVGIYFDASKKLSFRIESAGNILMSGYAKMTAIDVAKKVYKVTLFGSLGDVLGKMKNISARIGSQYPLFSDYFRLEAVNVRDHLLPDVSAVSDGTLEQALGFCLMNDGQQECNVNDKNVLDQYGIEEKLENKVESLQAKVTGESVVKEGVLPMAFARWKSYCMTPYLIWRHFCYAFQLATKNATGYDLILDSGWFNSSNPYYENYAMALKHYEPKEADTFASENAIVMHSYSGSRAYYFNYDRDLEHLIFDVKIQTHEDVPAAISPQGFGLGNQTGIKLVVKLVNVRGDIINQAKILLSGTYYTAAEVYDVEVRRWYEDPNIGGAPHDVFNTTRATATPVIVPYFFHFTTEDEMAGAKLVFEVGKDGLSQEDYVFWQAHTPSYAAIYPLNEHPLTMNILSNDLVLMSSKRSDVLVELADFFDNNTTPFDVFLNYTKIFGLKWVVDDFAKTITICDRPKFFEDAKIADWTDKVDISRTFEINPLLAESKYLLFGYKENKTLYGQKYNTEYGQEFGSEKIMLNYSFDDKVTQLFGDIPSSIEVSKNILYVWNWSDPNSFTHEIALPYFEGENTKHTDTFGAWFFMAPLTYQWGYDVQKQAYICDDSPSEKNRKIYCHNSIAESGLNCAKITEWRPLVLSRGNNVCTFGVPFVSYNKDTLYSDCKGIYSNFWKKYIAERYGRQNKKVTLFVKLTLKDINQFSFKDFVSIDGQIYHVNKIFDFDYNSVVNIVKVELVSVIDVDNYKNY